MPATTDPRDNDPTAAPARRRKGGPSGQELGLAKNPSWFVPLMCALLILGVLWLSVFYITAGDYPVPSIGYWNVGIGLGLLLSGFFLATRWQ